MIIVFNKATNPKITDIKIYTDSADILHWSSSGGNFWSIDNTNFKILCGGEGFVITFEDADSMKPYIDQFITAASGVIDPAINALNTDVYYDKPTTGGIVQHSYHPTDVEQDFIAKRPVD